MGGTSTSTTNQTSQLAPYSPASTGLNGLLGSLTGMAGSAGTINPVQSNSINQVIANSNGQPNYNSAIGAGTMGLLNGGGANNNNGAISSNYGTLNNNIGATASGSNIGGNSALKAQLDAMAADTANSINGQFAAAGRDGSPGNSQAVARGIAQGEAPIIAAQYNQDVSNQMNAANSLYGAGNATYGLLNQNQATANQNFTNGVGTVSAGLNAENAGPQAAAQAAGQLFGIPVSQLTTLLGAISPVAAQFGQQTGTSNTSSTMSPIQELSMLMQGAGSILGAGGSSSLGAKGATALFGA